MAHRLLDLGWIAKKCEAAERASNRLFTVRSRAESGYTCLRTGEGLLKQRNLLTAIA